MGTDALPTILAWSQRFMEEKRGEIRALVASGRERHGDDTIVIIVREANHPLLAAIVDAHRHRADADPTIAIPSPPTFPAFFVTALSLCTFNPGHPFERSPAYGVAKGMLPPPPPPPEAPHFHDDEKAARTCPRCISANTQRYEANAPVQTRRVPVVVLARGHDHTRFTEFI